MARVDTIEGLRDYIAGLDEACEHLAEQRRFVILRIENNGDMRDKAQAKLDDLLEKEAQDAP